VATLHQFYGSPGAPLVVTGDPTDAVTAWRRQRARLHAWLAALPDDDWSGPTRCQGWDVTLLVRHLSSATQFLGYTLREAAQGTATTLLEGMDTRTTVASAAEVLGDRSPAAARSFLTDLDTVVDGALVELAGRGQGDESDADGLRATAEAPPGHLPAHVVLRHFLFDSWVHEYDLLVPRGEQPPVDPLEAEVVVGYLIGFASISVDDPVPLELRLREPDLRIGVDVADGTTVVTTGRSPAGAAVVEGRAADVVDRLTGRPGGAVAGADAGLAVLDRFSLVLST